MRRVLVPLCLSLGLALAASGVRADDKDDEPLPGIGKPTGRLPTAGVSHWDVERIEDRDAGRLEKLGAIGRVWVKTVPIPWGRIEREAYKGGVRRYEWKDVDRAVLLWQLAGFEPVPVLSPQSSWAAQPPDKTAWANRLKQAVSPEEAEISLRTGLGTGPPRLGRWRDWEAFVEAFVERYDGDGRQDMPGLRRPLRYVQILDRVDRPSSWLGSADDYMRLLHHTGIGRDKANPGTRIIHAAIDLRVTGHAPMPPDEAAFKFRIEQQAPKAPAAARLEVIRSFEIIKRTIEMPRLFDAIAHVGSHNLQDDDANVRFLRALLKRAGGSEKEVWLVDNPVTKLADSRVPRVREPTRAERRVRARWLPVARFKRHSEHGKAMHWVRRGQAYDLIRSYCRARANGADNVLFFPRSDQVEDAPLKPDGDSGIPEGLISSVDDGSFITHTPGPMWYAWRQLWKHTRGHSKVVEGKIGAQGRSIVFDVPVKRRHPFVAVLLLDSHLSWAGEPGKPLERKRVAVPLPNGRYVLEDCDVGAQQPGRQEVLVDDGMLVVSIGPAPMFVIPQD